MDRTTSTPLTTSRYIWFKAPTDVYQPGQRLSLVLPESRSTEVEIVKAFTPFTNAVALLVDTQTPNTGLPNRLILKLADRRIDTNWNLEKEKEYQVNLPSYISRYGAPSALRFDKLWTPSGLKPDEPWTELFEVWRWSDHCHHREREAYDRLTEAQASGLIPRSFGTAKIEMMPTASHPSLHHIDGLLLEYIPGRTMASLRPGISITHEEAEVVSQRLLELGRRLRRYGVRHSDIHVGNVIIRSHDNSPVLIDWGRATFLSGDLPLQERWKDKSISTDFYRDIRYLLRGGVYYEGPEEKTIHPPYTAGGVWHRFRTPLSNQWLARLAEDISYNYANHYVEQLSPEEKERFYEEDVSVDVNCGVRWKVKEGVRTRDMEDDPCPEE